MSDSCGDAGRWSMSGSHVLANQLINKRRGKAEEREGEYQEEEDKKRGGHGEGGGRSQFVAFNNLCGINTPKRADSKPT